MGTVITATTKSSPDSKSPHLHRHLWGGLDSWCGLCGGRGGAAARSLRGRAARTLEMADDLAPSRELALEQRINVGGPDSGLGLTEPCPQGLGLVSSLTLQVSGSLLGQAAQSTGRRVSPSYPPQTTSRPCKQAFFLMIRLQ